MELTPKEIKMIVDKSIENARGSMLPAEEVVLDLIIEHGIISQQDIVRSKPWLGSHPTHETLGKKTTTRKVRTLIQKLIVDHGIPICSSQKNPIGFFFPKTQDDIDAEKAMKEGRARKYLQTAFEVMTAFEKAFDIELKSDFLIKFDKDELFYESDSSNSAD